MEITGRIIGVLPLQTGQGKNGVWKKQEFILETPGQYPKKVCLSLWGEKVDEYRVAEGETVTASINLESREYNGRWYTEARAWKLNKQTSGGYQGNTPPPIDASYTPESGSSTDDLPF